MSADVGLLPALDYTAYELARVAEFVAERAKAYPEAPAPMVLRSAMIARLSWDHAFPDAFADPSFFERFTELRRHVISAGCQHAADLPPILQAAADAAAARLVANRE